MENQERLENQEQLNEKSANEKLSPKEVEAMLPDYLFDRLSENERAEFEIAIINYPALEKELQEGKELFARVEALDYKKILQDKTQYLPDRVVARLEKQNALFVQKKPNIRRLVLAFAFAASVVIYLGVYNSSIHKSQDDDALTVAENSSGEQINNKFFSDLEKMFIAEQLEETEFFDNILYDESSVFDVLHNLNFNYFVLLDNIENMDEKTFRNFINSMN